MHANYDSQTWPDAFSVNVKLFDIQHQRLVALIAKLEAAMAARRANLEIAQILSDIADYTKEHFATEEAVMKAYEYPWRDSHALEHRQFIATIDKLQKQSASGEVAVSVALLNHLREWLACHVLGSDRRYSEHLNTRGMF